MENNILDCVIVGSGPAGFTAAIYSSKSKPETGTFHRTRTRRTIDNNYRSRKFPRLSGRNHRTGNDASTSKTSRTF